MSYVNLPLGSSSSAVLERGLWTLQQAPAPDPLTAMLPPRVVLEYPPAPPVTRRTTVGPAPTTSDPTISSEVIVSSRTFSLHGAVRLRGVSMVPPNDIIQAGFQRLGEPHPDGACPLSYTVTNPAGANRVWVPPWDGPYRVFTNNTCVALTDTRLSGEAFEVPAGGSIYVVQQAKL